MVRDDGLYCRSVLKAAKLSELSANHLDACHDLHALVQWFPSVLGVVVEEKQNKTLKKKTQQSTGKLLRDRSSNPL